VTTAPEPGRPLAETVAVVRDRGGVAVVPHPFQRSRHGVGRRALRACPGVGVEAYNAVAMTGLQNRRAQAFAREHDRPTLGGSDAHKPAAVGRAYTEVGIPTAEPLSSDLLLSAVRAGATTHVGRRTPLREYVTKVAHNVRLRTAATLFARGRSTR
jgi:predicted metal-dependent phosphoesterase TrpH